MNIWTRKRDFEVTTTDSLELGDVIQGHRDGLNLDSVDVPRKTWVTVSGVYRMANGDIYIDLIWEHKTKHTSRRKAASMICLPEEVVKRRLGDEL